MTPASRRGGPRRARYPVIATHAVGLDSGSSKEPAGGAVMYTSANVFRRLHSLYLAVNHPESCA